jgi:hypothetical protein
MFSFHHDLVFVLNMNIVWLLYNNCFPDSCTTSVFNGILDTRYIKLSLK